ncbi:transposase [uncultured Clostridium sp.]|uniref:RNA-guided endonuclease InsQ/TnpB family protein n=1 Tax=uncultured Clostridium sp. TaxID=59620 RepID=UPI002591CAEE|nr:transposase [uncultured Clostridium sp.]
MKTLKIRLYPTREQEILFYKHINCQRYIYNWALNLNNELYRKDKKKYSSTVLGKMLTQYKKQEVWLSEVSNATLKESIRNLDKAYTNFYKKRAKLPKFKSKKKSKLSFYSRYEKIKFYQNNTVNLEKIGKVKYKSSYNIDLTQITKFSNPHVSYNGRCWVLTLGIEVINEFQELTNEVIGIDLGVKYLAICSDGVVFKNINKDLTIKKLEKRLKRLQRKVSKKYELNKEGRSYRKSNNIIKLENKINRLYRKLHNIRLNHIHQTTSTIVKTKPCMIVMEDLCIKDMMKNKSIAKQVQKIGLYEFIRQMKYKCEWNSIRFEQVDRYFPSSKMCSNCFNIKKNLKLSDRTYYCEKCGLTIDRDFNASINLMNYGKSLL